MKYTKLGNSDLHVSRICLGCMGFGDVFDVAEANGVTLCHDRYKINILRGGDVIVKSCNKIDKICHRSSCVIVALADGRGRMRGFLSRQH